MSSGVVSYMVHGTNLLKDDVDAACQPLFSINIQVINLLHQLLHLLQRQLVKDAPQLAIHFLQQLYAATILAH